MVVAHRRGIWRGDAKKSNHRLAIDHHGCNCRRDQVLLIKWSGKGRKGASAKNGREQTDVIIIVPFEDINGNRVIDLPLKVNSQSMLLDDDTSH